MSRRVRVSSLALLVVALTLIVTAAWAATAAATTGEETTPWWVPVLAALGSAIVAGFWGWLKQSPVAPQISATLGKWLPDMSISDAEKASEIFARRKGRQDFVKWVQNYTLILLIGILMCGCLAPPAQCQVQPLTLAPVGMSMSVTPPAEAFATRSFRLTYFHDGEKDALGIPIAKWSFGNLSLAAVPILSTAEGAKTQIGIVEAFGYDVDCDALLERLGIRGVSLKLTPRYGPRQVNGEKPKWVPGITADVTWRF